MAAVAATVAAADELARGSVQAAERHLDLAERVMTSVAPARTGQAQLLLGVVRLLLARQRADLPAALVEARRLHAMAEAPDAAQPGLVDDRRALALISLGTTEYWTGRVEDAVRHLDRGVTLARQIGRPFLEFTGLAYQATAEFYRSFAVTAERSKRAIELAEQHGWTDEPAVLLPARFWPRCSPGRDGRTTRSPGFSAPGAPSGRSRSRPGSGHQVRRRGD